MPHRYLQIATTGTVRAERARYGSAEQYARLEGGADPAGPVRNDRLGPDEAEFIAQRDGFYVASVSETGWPYVQYRGGPPGFLRVIDEHTLGWADLRGNRQHITTGNVVADNRVSLILMDYANRRRLKIFGRMTVVHAADDPAPAADLAVPRYRGHVERAVTIVVEAFDWNCPQHITPRFTQEELAVALEPMVAKLRALEAENETLREERAKYEEAGVSARNDRP